jgi:hypothetical protein
MTHPDDLLASAVSGSISEEDRAQLDLHAATCERCRSQLAAALSARTALRELPTPEPPHDLSERIDQALRSAVPPREPRSRRVTWLRPAAALAAAASIGLAVFVVGHLGNPNGGPRANTEMIAGGGAGRGVPIIASSANYDAASIKELAQTPPGVATSPQVGASISASSQAATATVLACLKNGSAPSQGAQLVEIVQARYLGQPAYIGVYQIGIPPSRAEVWVVHSDTCGVFASANLSLHP